MTGLGSFTTAGVGLVEEPLVELVDVVLDRGVRSTSCVKVGREPARRFTDTELHRSATFDHARREHLRNDRVRDRSPQP